MGLRWIILWGGTGMLLAWRQGNLLIAVITLSTCLVLYALRDVVLRLIALQNHFGIRVEQDSTDDPERGEPI
jgi:hypothetical protein